MGATAGPSGVVTRYRRREIDEEDLQLIRDKIAEGSGKPGGRTAIAAAIAEAWDWRQPRGTLATRACVDLLLRLEEWGHIELPPVRAAVGSGPRRRSHPLLPRDLIPLTGLELRDPQADLNSLVVRPITPDEREGWRLYMGRYHYLGDRPIVGEHLLYAAFLGEELVALLGWGSAAFRAPLRETYVGWDESMKRERLHLVADNVRFLVLSWVHVRHLASKVLAMNLRRLSNDWVQTWGHPIHLAETFVDTRRFRGTCYRAANWIYLGQTAGRSKRGNTYLPADHPKALFVYPLHRQARQLLSGRTPQSTTSPGVPGALAAVQSAQPNPTVVRASEEGVHKELPVLSPVPKKSGRRGNLATLTAALTALGPRDELPLDLTTIEPNAEVQFALRAAEEAPRTSSSETSPGAHPSKGANATRIRIDLTDAEREALEQTSRGLAVPHRDVVRARIILLLAAGGSAAGIARKLGCARRIIDKWRERFARKRLDGLVDGERSGRPPRFSPRSRSSLGQAGVRAP
jgi:hypothetical protein